MFLLKLSTIQSIKLWFLLHKDYLCFLGEVMVYFKPCVLIMKFTGN